MKNKKLLEKTVEDFILFMEVSAKNKDVEGLEYCYNLFQTALPYLRNNKIWISEEQQQRISNAYKLIHGEK